MNNKKIVIEYYKEKYRYVRTSKIIRENRLYWENPNHTDWWRISTTNNDGTSDGYLDIRANTLRQALISYLATLDIEDNLDEIQSY